MITDLKTLADWVGFDDPSDLGAYSHYMCEDTSCGAHMTLYFNNGEILLPGDAADGDITDEAIASGLLGFKIGTIIEGSDAEIISELFAVPVDEAVLDRWVEDMEDEAEALWNEIYVDLGGYRDTL